MIKATELRTGMVKKGSLPSYIPGGIVPNGPAIVGKSGQEIIIIDDPLTPGDQPKDDEWFRKTLQKRLNK